MTKKQDFENIEDFEGMEEMFGEPDTEMLLTMSQVMNGYQKVAVDLTRLVLEHAKPGNVTKDSVFSLYRDALKVAHEEMGPER